MQDFSEVCLPTLSDVDEGDQRRRSALQPDYAASRVAMASLEVEDLVVQAYTRLLNCMVSVNETTHLRMSAHECQNSEELALSPKAQDTRLLCALTGLAVSLGLAASPVPRLRIRLVQLLTDALFSNQWTKTNTRLLSYQLLWFLNGKRGTQGQQRQSGEEETKAENAGEVDVALVAIRDFWPKFVRLFEELDEGV